MKALLLNNGTCNYTPAALLLHPPTRPCSLPPDPLEVAAFSLTSRRRTLAGSVSLGAPRVLQLHGRKAAPSH